MATRNWVPTSANSRVWGTTDQSGLTGDQRNAQTFLNQLMASFGLESLAPQILGFIRQGYSADTIQLLLQETPEWRQRFAANEIRRKAGKSVYSPAEYLSMERSYAAVMREAGVPVGFYDQANDFTDFIARDISPNEVSLRVNAAEDFINRADPGELAAMRQFYTHGDMIAFALDPERAQPLVGKAFNAAAVAGQAANQHIGIDQAQAESLAGLGVTSQQASRGFGDIATELPTAQKLASIDNTTLTVNDLIDETFRNDAEAARKRERLAQGEAARFGGTSGASVESLSVSKGGSL